jgi:hypothetical protein
MSFLWALPPIRAGIVGLVILAIRGFKSALGEKAVDAFASIASEMSILLPNRLVPPDWDELLGSIKNGVASPGRG